MAKAHYVCQQCGYSQVGWAGKCPNCDSWGTLVETQVETKKGKKGKSKVTSSKPKSLTSIKKKVTSRVSTKISELNRVLGGGLVPGQVVLLAGDPGIGKSTILLQVADKLATKTMSTLYVSGEESAQQIKVRGDRMAISSKNIKLLEETSVEAIIATIEGLVDDGDKPRMVVIDSIQTMVTEDLTGMAGSVGQVRECAYRLSKIAKRNDIPLFMVGHVTKEGTVAGPAVLSHLVDTVLWFEGDKALTLRLLRAVKNRFGATDEVGIFEMEDKGLNPIGSPEKLFLTKAKENVPGSVISSMLQGTRPILIEIQSLVVPSKLAYPKRVAQGIDSKRLELLLAVLQKRAGLPLYEFDVFVNVAGGINVKEPAVDLAICLSIASSYLDKAIKGNVVAVGEVGLLGEIREVVAQGKRIKESKRLGYKNVISSSEVKYIRQAIKKYFK